MSKDPNISKISKEILLGGGFRRPPCDHRGFLVPMMMIPQVIEVPQGENKETLKVQIYTTQTVKCMACPMIFTLGPSAPPDASGSVPPLPVTPPNAVSSVPHPTEGEKP